MEAHLTSLIIFNFGACICNQNRGENNNNSNDILTFKIKIWYLIATKILYSPRLHKHTREK